MSEFLENECNHLQSLDAATDPLTTKYGEIGIAAVAAAIGVTDITVTSGPRTESGEQRGETVVIHPQKMVRGDCWPEADFSNPGTGEMPRKEYTPEQIIQKLTEAEIRLGQGEALEHVYRSLAVSEQTFDRWRKEFGGLGLLQVQRALERENELLRRAVADLLIANSQLKDELGKDT